MGETMKWEFAPIHVLLHKSQLIIYQAVLASVLKFLFIYLLLFIFFYACISLIKSMMHVPNK